MSDDSPKRAVIYVRQSFDRTGERAGVERQEEACRGLATARGWEVVKVCPDNSVSASTGRVRPGWEAVLSLVEEGAVDVVIAWHMDRLTRTMGDLERLILLAEDHGVGVATATGDIDLTTDAGRMVARILAAVARQEVERKSARQKLAAQQRANQGKPWWVARPFGYNQDGTLNEAEAPAVQQAFRDVLTGGTLTGIAERWNRAGHLTNQGNAWQSHTVRPVLLAARNAAISTYLGEEVGPGSWQPMVGEDTWRAAVHVLTNPARNSGGGGKPQGLLTGFATCGVCGATCRVAWKGRKNAEGSFRRYICGNGGHVSMPADFVDGRVYHALLRDRPKEWTADTRFVDANVDVAELVAEENALRLRLDSLATEFADGDLTASQLNIATERIKSRLIAVETKLAQAGQLDLDWIADDIEYMAQELDAMPIDKKRALVRKLIKSVVIMPRGRGVTELRQEDVRIEFPVQQGVTS